MLGLCERFKCLPSELENESAEILRLVRIEQLGKRQRPENELGELDTDGV